MTETTQLGLPIYGENDVPLWTNTNDGFEALDSLVNSCADVELDWSHPLHTFNAGNLSYTVTEDDCYLCGQTYGSTSDNHIYINDTIIAVAFAIANNFYLQNTIPPIKLSKGDVVRVDSAMSILRVFKGKLVSGNTYVFNEAQVTLDYAHPLFTFNTNNLSYTATKKCYLAGTIPGLWDGFVNLSIDGTLVYQSSYSNSVGQAKPIPILTIEKGSTVSLNRWSGSSECLHVFDGTVTGSVSALHSNIPDYSNLLASLAYDDATYTATEECIVEMQLLALSASERAVVKINNNDIGFSLNDAGGYIPFDKTIHLQKGDVLTWSNAHSGTNLFVCNVFGIL